MTLYLIECYCIIGVVLGLFSALQWGQGRPANQAAAIGVCSWALSPVLLPPILAGCIWVGGKFIGSGIRDLYRSLFPKKPEIPQARLLP